MDIEKDNVEGIIHFMMQNSFRGFNITVPYKEAVIGLLDSIDPAALAIGAVNCIKIDGMKLSGYNTDLYGIEKTFEVNGISLNNKRVLVLGAGGSTRALLFYLKSVSGLEVTIANRTVEKAQKLNSEMGCNFIVRGMNSFHKEETYDIIINSTSISITGGGFDWMNNIYCREFLYDFQYVIGKKTQFLEYFSNKMKAKSTDGLDMLIFQAYKAFSIFNDINFDFDIADLKRRIGEENAVY